MAAPKHSTGKTLFVAIFLGLICSILVSASVVLLQERQQDNMLIFKRSNVLAAAGVTVATAEVNQVFEQQIVVYYLDLNARKFVPAPADPTFDSVDAARDPRYQEIITPQKDLARIKRRSRISEIYLLKKQPPQSTPQTPTPGTAAQSNTPPSTAPETPWASVILPVRGKGLWSTMKGFLALDPGSLDIKGLSFYAHGETPGLGGEIDNPRWRAQWVGKKIYDPQGLIALKVLKGMVSPDDPLKDYRIDGLSGATLTSDGVSKMIAYWLGTEGYRAFLEQQRAENWQNMPADVQKS